MKSLLITLIFLTIVTGLASQTSPPGYDPAGNSVRKPGRLFQVSSQASDGGNPWTPVGPYGGDVVDMGVWPVVPGRLFAAAGIPFVSEDGGQNWVALDALSVLSSGNVNAVEATGNGRLFATCGYTYGKVFRSLDGGTTWHTRNIPVNSSGLCIAADPGDTSTLYVGLSSNSSWITNKVIVKSTDGGNTWSALDLTTALPVGNSVMSICVDPDNSLTIFAIGNSGFSGALVAASFDGGANWEDRSGNLPVGVPYNDVAIADQKVFVAGGQLFGSQYMGIYRSNDYGITWSNISASFPNKVSNAIMIDPSDINKMFVATEGDGIYYSTDGGTIWYFDATGAGENGAARCLIFSQGSSDTIYTGFLSLAVCRSVDAGMNWEYANQGIGTLLVNDIETDPADPSVVLTGFEAENSGGCYISFDNAVSWQLVTGLPGTRFSQVTIGAAGDCFAWSNGPSTVAQEGLYKSTDGGVTWTNTGPNVGPQFETQVFALAASATNPGLLFIGGNNFGVNGWESIIYRTTNGGQTWENVFTGSPDNSESIRYLFIDPNSNDQVIYAAFKSELAGGFLKSDDGGTTWDPFATGIPGTFKWGGSIVCDPDDQDRIYAGCGGQGENGTVYFSQDGGNSWSGSNLNLYLYSKIQDILVSREYPEVVYIASSQNGVYISTDAGMNWEEANEDLPAGNITGFSHPFTDSNTWQFYASTFTHSAFRTVIYDPNVGMSGKNERDGYFSVCPNPSDGTLYITLKERQGNDVYLGILNSTGSLVSELYINICQFRNYTMHIEVPPGLYFLWIISRDRTEFIKIIIRDDI